MNIFLLSFLILFFFTLIILFAVYYETKLPKLSETGKNVLESVSEWLMKLNKKNKFNGAILYIENNEVLLEKYYGFTSYKRDQCINSDTMFRLGSVSKQFTAFGIMVLEKNKVLKYDDLVKQYIQDFPYPEVSIRHLLNQTSGISVDYMKLAKKNVKQVDHILDNEAVVKLICAFPDDVIIQPRTQYFYNNTNYIILARLIEIVSAGSFEEYMKSNVFEPLKLENTRVWNLKSKTKFSDLKNVAEGFEAYFNTKPIQIKPNWIDGVAGDGAIFSSISDLKKWNHIWYENSILTRQEISEAFKKPILLDGSESEYGFGWVIQGETVWHNGKWLASNSLITRNIKDLSCFVLLDNSSNVRFNKISKQLRFTLSKKKNNTD